MAFSKFNCSRALKLALFPLDVHRNKIQSAAKGTRSRPSRTLSRLYRMTTMCNSGRYVSYFHISFYDSGRCTFACFETALRAARRRQQWRYDGAFCISTSYWQIATEGTRRVGEGSGPIRSDPERLPIVAVVSDKNVPGGAAAEPLAFPFFARLPFTKCLIGTRKY